MTRWREIVPALAAGVTGLILRAVYLLESSGNPFRLHLGLDTAGYDRWARAVLAGQGLGEAPFTQASLFPLLLALAYALLGPDPASALWMHLLPGGVAAFLVADAARRWRGPAAAWGAGLLVALYKPAIFYTGILLPPAWVVALAAFALWSVVVVWSTKTAGHGRLAVSGVAFGLLTVAQPAAGVAMLPALWWIARDRSGRAVVSARREATVKPTPGWRDPSTVRRAAAFLAGFALLPLLTLVYNGLAGRAWVPIAVNGGINLYIGNGPEANGAYVRPPEMREDRDLLGIEAARRLSGRSGTAAASAFSAVQADRFWRGRALGHMVAEPGHTLRLYARKLILFFGQYEVPQVESLPFERRFSWMLRLPLPGMAFLAAVAFFGFWKLRRDPTARWLAASVAAIALAVSLFFVTDRFRAPVVPFLALLAGGGIGAFATDMRSPATRRAVALPALASALLAALLVLNGAGLDRGAGDGQYHYRLGLIREAEQRPADAMEEYARALALDPTLGKAEVNLGTLLARAGRLQEARVHLERGVGLDPQSAIGLANLGQLNQLEGRPDEALALYRRALEVDPGYVTPRRAAARLLREMGREEEARALGAE